MRILKIILAVLAILSCGIVLSPAPGGEPRAAGDEGTQQGATRASLAT
jgi:hypothetical protein